MKRSEVTRYWMNKGLSWIAANPGRFFLLECLKLVRFLGSYEYSTEYIIYVERESVKSLWLSSLPFAMITGLAAAGILMQRKHGFRPPAMLLGLFVLSNSLVVMMFYVSSRYRMPSAPYLILFAAAGVERLWDASTSRVGGARTDAVIYGLIAAGLFGIFHLQVDGGSRIQEANTHYNMGNEHYRKKQYERALAEYDRAIAGDKSNWRAYFNKANTLASMGRKPEAIDLYREVLKLNKNMTSSRRQIELLGGAP